MSHHAIGPRPGLPPFVFRVIDPRPRPPPPLVILHIWPGVPPPSLPPPPAHPCDLLLREGACPPPLPLQLAWPGEAFVLSEEGLPVPLQLPLLEHLASVDVE